MDRLGRGARTAIVILIGLVVLWLLFTLVFPWVERQMEDPTLGTGQVVARAV